MTNKGVKKCKARLKNSISGKKICKNRAKFGNLCGIHKNALKCKAFFSPEYFGDKRPCTNNAKKNSKFCGIHSKKSFPARKKLTPEEYENMTRCQAYCANGKRCHRDVRFVRGFLNVCKRHYTSSLANSE